MLCSTIPEIFKPDSIDVTSLIIIECAVVDLVSTIQRVKAADLAASAPYLRNAKAT